MPVTADIWWKMLYEDDHNDSPEKYRERRRRRVHTRRSKVVSAASVSTSQNREDDNPRGQCPAKRLCIDAEETKGVNSAAFEDVEGPASKAEKLTLRRASEMEPVYGTMSVMGRTHEMEDAIAVVTNLCRPKISNWSPVHFIAVYDGHGGSHVSALCSEKMHLLLQEELMRVEGGPGIVESSRAALEVGSKDVGDCYSVAESWKRVLRMSFERLDKMALTTCACGRVGQQCDSHSMEVALGGTTAVVAVLTPEHIVVANCGDSRAVLCHGGMAMALSHDHKPDRPDERARIEAAGGRVIFLKGARVEGILAMSRAIGDKYLKPHVTSEPEVTVTKRSPDDECLILASDGLWDVISNELACEVAVECLHEAGDASTSNIDLNVEPSMGNEPSGGVLYPPRSDMAAALLTRLALARKSSDNVSVIVVDLKRIREKRL